MVVPVVLEEPVVLEVLVAAEAAEVLVESAGIVGEMSRHREEQEEEEETPVVQVVQVVEVV
jgi:archaellin